VVTEMPWAPKKEHRSGRASMRQTLAASSSTTVHAIEERAQADEAAQDALTEAERIRDDADTQIAQAATWPKPPPPPKRLLTVVTRLVTIPRPTTDGGAQFSGAGPLSRPVCRPPAAFRVPWLLTAGRGRG